MQEIDISRFRLMDYLIGKDLCHIGTCRFSSSEGGLHCHDFFEVFWVQEGLGVHRINGREEILGEGAVCWIQPDDVHRFESDSHKPLVMTNVAFSPMYAMRMLALADRSTRDQILFTPFTLTPEGRRILEEDAKRLAEDMTDPWRLYRLLSGLAADAEEGRGAWSEREGVQGWLAEALEHVSDPEVLAGGVEEWVRIAGRSHEHVTRECRRVLGQRPVDLITRARMTHAARLLRTGDQKLIDISMDCGYDSPSRFHVLFKREFGQTPDEYRRLGSALIN